MVDQSEIEWGNYLSNITGQATAEQFPPHPPLIRLLLSFKIIYDLY